MSEIKKILCWVLGHIPVRGKEKDMFGREYVWQKVHCKRCIRRLN